MVRQSVKTWYWEVWNEPNISYWKGTMEEYFKLYDYTADAVKKSVTCCNNWRPHFYRPGLEQSGRFQKVFYNIASMVKIM